MAQLVKVAGTKSEDLSSTPRTTWWQVSTNSQELGWVQWLDAI